MPKTAKTKGGNSHGVPPLLNRTLVAERVQLGREWARMDVSELAKALGVSYQAIWRWEHAKDLPDLGHVVALSLLLKRQINWLLGLPRFPWDEQ